MGLETGSYIGDLVSTNPLGSDAKSTADDHLRLIKDVNKRSFGGFSGAILVTGTDTGSANTYVLTPTTAITAYGTNMLVVLKPITTNTGASTLNISGIGATSILAQDGSALIAGDIKVGSDIILVYNGTNFLLSSVSKAYIDNLSFAGALPSAPVDGAVPQYLNGSVQWAYVSNMYPKGDSIAANSLVAIDQNGSSASVGTISSVVISTTATDYFYKTALVGGNLLSAFIQSNTVKVTIENPTTGAILYGPTTISPTGTQTESRCSPLANGGAVITWMRSGVGTFYAIVSSTGTITLTETALTVVATSTGNVTSAQLVSGDILFGCKTNASYPAFLIMSQAGASVKAITTIVAAAVYSSEAEAIALSNGNGALVWGTATKGRFATYTSTGTAVVAATDIVTATNVIIRGNQISNGNIVVAYTNSGNAYMSVITVAGATVVSATQIGSNTVSGGSVIVSPLTGGSAAIGYVEATTSYIACVVIMPDGTITSPRFRVGAGTASPNYFSMFPTKTTASNGFYYGYLDTANSSYQTFIGPYKNNYIVGISRGYTTTKQLVDAFGEYNTGGSTIDTLEKKVNYTTVSTRLIF